MYAVLQIKHQKRPVTGRDRMVKQATTRLWLFSGRRWSNLYWDIRSPSRQALATTGVPTFEYSQCGHHPCWNSETSESTTSQQSHLDSPNDASLTTFFLPHSLHEILLSSRINIRLERFTQRLVHHNDPRKNLVHSSIAATILHVGLVPKQRSDRLGIIQAVFVEILSPEFKQRRCVGIIQWGHRDAGHESPAPTSVFFSEKQTVRTWVSLEPIPFPVPEVQLVYNGDR